MDDGSVALLQQLIASGGRSLLQYVSESSPFTTEKTEPIVARIITLAQDERAAIGKLLRYLQKKHVRPVITGSYPAYFTTMNFMPIDYLLPKLIVDAQRQITVLEKSLATIICDEVRTIAMNYLEMKRRHLEILQELSATRTPIAS